MVAQVSSSNEWVMEGIYGLILQNTFPCITTLIWLDILINECIDNVKKRGPKKDEDDSSFNELLEYAGSYLLRKNNMNAYDGHKYLFNKFSGIKFRITSREEMDLFLLQL